MQCVLLAAGEGKRMRPLTAHRPKVMLPVAGRPILEHVLERVAAAGFRDLLLITHYQAGAVRAHFGTGRAWGVRIRYLDQGAAAGTGHAVARLKGHVKAPFALFYADSLYATGDLAKFHKANGLTVGAKRVPDARPYGLLAVRGDRLVKLEEKPAVAKSGLVNVGAYTLTPALVDRCARLSSSPRGELELTDALQEAAASNPVRVLPCDSWQDVGRPWDLLTVQEQLMSTLKRRVEGRVDASAVLEGPVVVEKGAHVRHGTVIEGPCIIQAGARVGPHAYLRGATVVGRGCHVGASVEIKNSILFEEASVPHLSYVGDSILGARVNLGAGTIVANLKHSGHNVRVAMEGGDWVDTGRRKFGVIIGDDVKTGINTTLNVGAVLGPGARVLPGRVVDGWVPAGATVA